MTMLQPALPQPDVVQFFKLLADETRLAIVRGLAVTDLRAGEVVARVGQPQNVVSYHLKQLRQLGVVHDRRSSSDARDIYYSLDLERLHGLYAAAGDALHPGLAPTTASEAAVSQLTAPLRILFLCTHNSARSQLAEGIARQLGGDAVTVASAGSEPTEVHPMTYQLLHEWDIDTRCHRAKHVNEFVGQTFDYVITVCDYVHDNCPTFPGDPDRIHWSFPDPAALADPEQQLQAFRTVRRELCTRIRYLLSLPHPVTRQRLPLQSIVTPEESPR